jgi:type II secretory pathway pseudopilin PulG
VDRLLSRLGVRRPLRDDDGGFSLVEVTVSLVVLTVTMTSALTLFVRAMGNADVQSQRQQAISIANEHLEQARAVDAVNLIDGRGLTAVQGIWGWQGSLTSTLSVLTSDPTAALTGVGLIPTIKTVTVDNVPYTVRTYIDTCYLPSSSTNCTALNVSGSKAMYRVSVSVAWSPKKTRSCGAGALRVIAGSPDRCQEYVVTTLRDNSADPTFNTN